MEAMLNINKESKNKDLTTGSLAKKLIFYIVPLFLSSSLSLLFTTMDLFTVAQFGGGDYSSAAIGSTNALINILLTLFIGLSSGASVVIANAKGENDKEKLLKSIGTTIFLTIFLSIIILVIGMVCSKQLLILLDTDPNLLEQANNYLFIYFIGTPFNLLFQCGAAIFRAIGDSKRPLISISLGGVINIGLNFLTVVAFKLDVVGVAIATIASQFVSTVVIFLFLFKDKRYNIGFKLKYVKYFKCVGKEIIKIGLASGLQSLIFNITNVVIQFSVNNISTAVVVGNSAASNLGGYQYNLLNSISIACSISVAQNYGAKNKERVRKSLIYTIIFELVFVTIFDFIMLGLYKELLGLYLNEAEVALTPEATQHGLTRLVIMGAPYAFCGIAECFTGYLRGLKYSLVPSLVSLACIVGIRLIFILCLFNLIDTFHTYTWLIAIYPISWACCILVYIPIYFKYTKKSFAKLDLKIAS